MKKRIINGELCCGIADAAKYLCTNNKKIKVWIGEGKIKLGPQPKLNCQRLYVRVDSLIQYKYGEARRNAE